MFTKLSISPAAITCAVTWRYICNNSYRKCPKELTSGEMIRTGYDKSGKICWAEDTGNCCYY